MKKVLLIAFSYPPLAGMGMLRSLKFAKYLPAFGWKPVVLTVDVPPAAAKGSSYWYCDAAEGNLPDVEIIRTKYVSPKALFKFLLNSKSPQPDGSGDFRDTAGRREGSLRQHLRGFWNEWIEYPDNAIGWYPYAVKDGTAYLLSHSVDVIFSTALPMTSHLIANTLSRRTGIPWVADFRDPWSQAHYRNSGRLRREIDKWVETKVVGSAGALTSVSEGFMEDFLEIHKTFSARNSVIFNGYDEDDYLPAERPPGRPLTITFTGRMYEMDFLSKGRTPEILFQSLAELFREKTIPTGGIQCLIYGEYPGMLSEMIVKYDLAHAVKCLGAVPFREAIKAQSEADVLLLLSWNDADRKGVLPGKIFEYLGAKRPILSIPFTNRDVDGILQKTQAGSTLTDAVACKQRLCAWYGEFTRRGRIHYEGIPERIEEYSRKEGAKKLASVLNVLSAGKSKRLSQRAN